MSEETRPGEADELAQARETIARQAKEIERLRHSIADESFAEDLGKALILAASAGTLASPVTHSRLLEMIVQTASHVINAEAGSLLLIDEQKDELVFEVALGGKADEVTKFRVPLGHGVAGLVALSGQPMAVTNEQRDPTQASDIARQVGYIPRSILCVPLFYSDRVTGVLELFDKKGQPGFSAEDIESLSLFAGQAAVAIEQSRTHRHLAAFVGEMLESLKSAPEHQRQGLLERVREYTRRVEEEDAAFGQAFELSELVHEIVWQGDREAQACITILKGFADYLRTRSATMNMSPWGGLS